MFSLLPALDDTQFLFTKFSNQQKNKIVFKRDIFIHCITSLVNQVLSKRTNNQSYSAAICSLNFAFFLFLWFLYSVCLLLCVCVCLNVVGTTAVVKGAYSHGLFTLSELISLFLLCYCQRHELIQLQMQHAFVCSPSLPYFPLSIAHAQNPARMFPSLLICRVFLLYFCLCTAVKSTLPEFHTHKLVYWHTGAVAVILKWTCALSVVCFYMAGFKFYCFCLMI